MLTQATIIQQQTNTESIRGNSEENQGDNENYREAQEGNREWGKNDQNNHTQMEMS